MRGQLIRTWGDVPYPEERVYNDYGEMTELHTFQGGTGWNRPTWPANPGSSNVTTWNYHEPSGVLLSKTDAAGHSVTNTYYPDGSISNRIWARGIRTTFTYNSLGDLERLDYSDTTNSVLFTDYNRASQPRSITNIAGAHSLIYDYAGRLVSDHATSGLLSGLTVSNHFDPLRGRDLVVLLSGTNAVVTASYGYDDYNRLNAVTSGVETVSYGYAPNSDRLQATSFKHNGTSVLTTTRAWEFDSRLQSIANSVNNAPVSSHRYQYDAANRRTRVFLEDGSLWAYGYDSRDQVTSARSMPCRW